MRVLLDANTLISFLLHPERSSPVTAVVREGILGHFTLLVPERLLEELEARVADKPYLAERIDREDLEELVAILRQTAEMLPEIEEPVPAVVRDQKDDYLIAHAVMGQADYLVTGDDDLLSLGRIDAIRILSPRQFWDLLKAQP